jgi:hypothetical protein
LAKGRLARVSRHRLTMAIRLVTVH